MDRDYEIKTMMSESATDNYDRIERGSNKVQSLLKTLYNQKAKHNPDSSLAFFIIGCINNTGYVLVLTSAQSLAHKFHEDKFMGIFTL